ncbi:MAG: winged helix-turn-helix transcriptional regulator [Chloroflexota bacterium]
MTTRSYNQYCGLAYALDIVGERWTLLIIRELMVGPRRFKDLIDGLPGISTNLLSERLKSLEQQGLLCRRVLPPPAGSTVYELTALGQALETTLLELGKWGSQFVPPSANGATLLNVGSYALTLKTFFRPELAQGVHETYELHVDHEILQVRINEGEIEVCQGETSRADVIFQTDMPTYLGLLQGGIMAASNSTSESTFRLADRLAMARRGRFVGREAEVELFRSALLAAEAEPSFAVLHLYGPGGIGKTTLLREYARIAAETGCSIALLDRNLDPSPSGFLLALRQALGLEDSSPDLTFVDWPANLVLLIDTYETLTSLDTWLRETFLPQLPGRSLVVFAGRHPPAPAWRTDLDWAGLTRILPLRNLHPEESQTYLAIRGVPTSRHQEVLNFTHGHPLALSLVADILSQNELDTPLSFQTEPDVVRVLLKRFVQDVPSPNHRLTLQVCALAWATTEALLAQALDMTEAAAMFDWLQQLSFIETGPLGLFPHDLARDVLDADFRWRDPAGYRQLNQRLTTQLYARLQQVGGVEQQRLWFDLLYLARHNPFFKPYFDWDTFHSALAEPASGDDAAAILEMVQMHEGDASAHVAHYWLGRQPQAFQVYRNADGELIGFMAHLTLHQVTPADIATDPAVPAALNFVQQYGPLRSGEEILYLRFWMGRETYQEPSPALNLTAINSTIDWTTRPKLAWNFVPAADPAFHQPHFTSLNMRRSPEADFEVGGRRYGLFTHDWRVEPVSAWLSMKAEREPQPDLTLDQVEAALPRPLLVLSQPEFEAAVRQALRDYTRPDLLAINPLMRSRLVVELAEPGTSPATLQTLLDEAAASLTSHPKDEKLYRAIYHTYLEPAPSQERAAELLDLPFTTYRYHLAGGLKRITEWLWQRELHDFEP